MENEEKNSPTFKATVLEPNEPIKIKIVSAKPVSTGTNTYGEWNMWVIEVDDQKVFERGSKTPLAEKYTGEAICFPSPKLHESFLGYTNEQKANVEIELKLVPKKSSKGGFYTTYETTLIKDGEIPSESVDYANSKYLEDFKVLVTNKILENKKEDFVNYGQRDPYKLQQGLLEDLWVTYQNVKEE